MKKVLIIVAGLFGAALLTTSCVETQESATVTAMREAKLAQLQAQADQARYQAQLDSIEAAIKNATSAAELEALLLKQQQALLEAQQQMERIQREMENDANSNIITLFNNYKSEVSELNGLKSQLNQQNANLAMYENNLISAEAAVATQTAYYQNLINVDSAKLLAYQAYSGLDYSELEAEENRLTAEKEIAQSARNVAQRERFNTLEPKNELIAPFDFNNGVNEKSHRMLIAMDSIMTLANNPNSVFGQYYSGTAVNYISGTSVVIKDERFKDTNDNLDGHYNNYVNSITIGVRSIYPEDILQMAYDIKVAIGEPAKDATNTASAVPATNLYLDVDNAEAALKSANEALTNAREGDDEQVIINAQESVYKAERRLADAQEKLNNALGAQAAFERLAAEVDINGEAYKAYIDEINALAANETIVAYFEACVAYDEAVNNFNEIDAQLNIVTKLKNQATDIDAKIAELEKNIAEYKARIDNLGYEEGTYWFDNNNNNQQDDGELVFVRGSKVYETLIQQTQDEIANLTEQIALQEEIVALAKAALDAALAGESTPAE